MTLTEVPDPGATLATWWGLVPLTPEQAVAVLVAGWASAPLWAHQLVTRAGGLRPWYRRRPLARRRSDGNRARWTPQVPR